MKKIFIFLFIFIFYNTLMVFAQDDKTSMIGLSFGYTFAGFREETIADVNRYLNTVVFSIHSVVDKEPFVHTHNIGFFSGKNELLAEYPVYQFENEYADYYKVQDTYSKLFLEYALAGKLWGGGGHFFSSLENFPGYLGGAVRGDLNIIQTLANPMYINFTAIMSLNLHASQKWIIDNKNSMTLSLSIPVFGYALRPNYIGMSAWPLETGFVSLHNYWACFGSLKYYYRVHEFLSLYSDIGFEIAQINFPRTRKDASLDLKIGAVYVY